MADTNQALPKDRSPRGRGSQERPSDRLDLRRYMSELERRNRELENYTRTVAHDLKAPLATVYMQLQALEKACCGASEDCTSRIEGALDTVSEMRRLVRDLLDQARSGDTEMTLEPVDCGALVERVLAELWPAIDAAGATVTCEPLPRLQANGTRLTQLFQNLVTNAIKYRSDGAPVVVISAEYEGPDWVFSVKDNGCGIALEDRERVFDVFMRVNGDGIPGSGVGLSICKQAVEAHGGRIWLDSEPGRGTTFYFSLPGRRRRSTGKPARQRKAAQRRDDLTMAE